MTRKKSETAALETNVKPAGEGVQTFQSGLYEWQYTDKEGKNVSMKRMGDVGADFAPMVRAETLNEAILYAHGWEAGYGAKR